MLYLDEAERSYLEFTAVNHVIQYNKEVEEYGVPSFDILDTLADVADGVNSGFELPEDWLPDTALAAEELAGWLMHVRNTYRVIRDASDSEDERRHWSAFIDVQSSIIRKLQLCEVPNDD